MSGAKVRDSKRAKSQTEAKQFYAVMDTVVFYLEFYCSIFNYLKTKMK